MRVYRVQSKDRKGNILSSVDCEETHSHVANITRTMSEGDMIVVTRLWVTVSDKPTDPPDPACDLSNPA